MCVTVIRAEAESGVELLQFLQQQVRDESGAIGDPIDFRVVQQYRHAVPRELDVGLEDRRARGEAPLECE